MRRYTGASLNQLSVTAILSRTAGLRYPWRMHRTALLATLETANRHVADGERHIERQREIVARLEERGRGTSHTATIARELLHSMERIQRAEQIKAELARLDGFDRSLPPSLI